MKKFSLFGLGLFFALATSFFASCSNSLRTEELEIPVESVLRLANIFDSSGNMTYQTYKVRLVLSGDYEEVQEKKVEIRTDSELSGKNLGSFVFTLPLGSKESVYISVWKQKDPLSSLAENAEKDSLTDADFEDPNSINVTINDEDPAWSLIYSGCESVSVLKRSVTLNVKMVENIINLWNQSDSNYFVKGYDLNTHVYDFESYIPEPENLIFNSSGDFYYFYDNSFYTGNVKDSVSEESYAPFASLDNYQSLSLSCDEVNGNVYVTVSLSDQEGWKIYTALCDTSSESFEDYKTCTLFTNDDSISTTITLEDTCVYKNNLYVLYSVSSRDDPQKRKYLRCFDISDFSKAREIKNSFDTFDSYIKEHIEEFKNSEENFSINDICANEDGFFTLVSQITESSSYTNTDNFYTEENPKLLLSRGALIKMSLKLSGFEYLGLAPSSGTQKYRSSPSPSRWYFSLVCPSAKNSSSFFYGPERFIGIIPKKLVIADDGYSFILSDDRTKINALNKNRLVYVDLEKMAIESVTDLDDTEFTNNDPLTVENDSGFIEF